MEVVNVFVVDFWWAGNENGPVFHSTGVTAPQSNSSLRGGKILTPAGHHCKLCDHLLCVCFCVSSIMMSQRGSLKACNVLDCCKYHKFKQTRKWTVIELLFGSSHPHFSSLICPVICVALMERECTSFQSKFSLLLCLVLLFQALRIQGKFTGQNVLFSVFWWLAHDLWQC